MEDFDSRLAVGCSCMSITARRGNVHQTIATGSARGVGGGPVSLPMWVCQNFQTAFQGGWKRYRKRTVSRFRFLETFQTALRKLTLKASPRDLTVSL